DPIYIRSVLPPLFFWKPNARRQARLEACARTSLPLEAVACKRLILIEAPSSAYHRGMLNWERCSLAHEEETSGDSPPNSTHFIVVSTGMLAPCTSVSSTGMERCLGTAT